MTEEIVKAQLPEHSFKRWKLLMIRIELLNNERTALSLRMIENTKSLDAIYDEMQMLWVQQKVKE